MTPTDPTPVEMAGEIIKYSTMIAYRIEPQRAKVVAQALLTTTEQLRVAKELLKRIQFEPVNLESAKLMAAQALNYLDDRINRYHNEIGGGGKDES